MEEENKELQAQMMENVRTMKANQKEVDRRLSLLDEVSIRNLAWVSGCTDTASVERRMVEHADG